MGEQPFEGMWKYRNGHTFLTHVKITCILVPYGFQQRASNCLIHGLWILSPKPNFQHWG